MWEKLSILERERVQARGADGSPAGQRFHRESKAPKWAELKKNG